MLLPDLPLSVGRQNGRFNVRFNFTRLPPPIRENLIAYQFTHMR